MGKYSTTEHYTHSPKHTTAFQKPNAFYHLLNAKIFGGSKFSCSQARLMLL
ncbi:hypothetical protein I79_009094 [Cricetulus griseus]|uniref:Uncharacterized protein n=1 Tax=Cricetulus griseus TaxID=10029 RepID=G3HEU7_CRIGR|nr:hypothetical protein I79_009094 [Cricetulus griseus]